MENVQSDKITLDALALKQIGDGFNKIKFHLDAALNEYNSVKKKCGEIERDTGVKMHYLAD